MPTIQKGNSKANLILYSITSAEHLQGKAIEAHFFLSFFLSFFQLTNESILINGHSTINDTAFLNATTKPKNVRLNISLHISLRKKKLTSTCFATGAYVTNKVCIVLYSYAIMK